MIIIKEGRNKERLKYIKAIAVFVALCSGKIEILTIFDLRYSGLKANISEGVV